MPAVSRRAKPDQDEAAAGGRGKSLKEARLLKNKEKAGKEFNWSMLYMNVCLPLSVRVMKMIGVLMLDFIWGLLFCRAMRWYRPLRTG